MSMRGIFAVYKPKGITSHDMVNRVRRATGEKRVGHAGTLDPLAEGVLVIAVGRENTKKISETVAKEKEYVATILFGKTSSTDDQEGQKSEINFYTIPSKKEIENSLYSFIGDIMQIPPAFSALKIKGTAAYKLARKGKEPEIKARRVFIKSIELLDYNFPFLKIKVITGPGVYIRSLARDIGKVLNTGGYLHELVRTRVGEYTVDNCVDIEKFSID